MSDQDTEPNKQQHPREDDRAGQKRPRQKIIFRARIIKTRVYEEIRDDKNERKSPENHNRF